MKYSLFFNVNVMVIQRAGKLLYTLKLFFKFSVKSFYTALSENGMVKETNIFFFSTLQYAKFRVLELY